MAFATNGQEKIFSLGLDSTDYGISFPAKASSTHSPGKASLKKRVQVFISTHAEEIKESARFFPPTAAPVTSSAQDIMAVDAAIAQDSASLELTSRLSSASTELQHRPASLSESPFVAVQLQACTGLDRHSHILQCPMELADNHPASVSDSMRVDRTPMDNTPGAGLSPPSLTPPKSSAGKKLFPNFINPFSRSTAIKQDSASRPSKPSLPFTNGNSSSSSPKALLSKFSNSMARIKAVFSPRAPAPAVEAVGADASGATEVPSACSAPSTPSSHQQSIKCMRFSLASFKAPFKFSFTRKPAKQGSSSTAGRKQLPSPQVTNTSTVERMQPPPHHMVSSSTAGSMQLPPSDVTNSSSTITTDTASNQPMPPAPPVVKSASPRLSSLQSAANGSLRHLISKAKGIGKKRKQHPTANQH